MTEERRMELKEQLLILERRIRPLAWDASRNQINEFRKQQLVKLQQEQANLQKELQSLEQPQ